MEDIFNENLVKDVGFGGVMGFIVGYTLKRVLKFFMLIIGLYILSLIWLADIGVISVEWAKLEEFLRNFMSQGETLVKNLVRTVSFGGSFAVGFAIGWKV